MWYVEDEIFKFMIKERVENNNLAIWCKTNHQEELLEQWDYSKNAPLTPYDIMSKSNKKVWWKCSNGHSFQSKICHRVDKHGCPYCAGQKPILVENDLKTLYFVLCSQWDYNKNAFGPEHYLPSSNKKVWWKCDKGHSWEAVISSRTKGNRGCPFCWKENRTSFNEQAVFFYVKKYFPDAINSDRVTIGIELDIYIPSINVAIEYDGLFWHSHKHLTDIRKNELCTNNGIRLIRLRENGLPDINESSVNNQCMCITVFSRDDDSTEKTENDIYELERAINMLLAHLGKKVKAGSVDIKRDREIIMSHYIISRKENSLLALYRRRSGRT